MKIQALYTLREIIRCGSYAAAADACNLTPSAVSLQMKQLEMYFGRPLFDRSSRTVRPTELAFQVTEKMQVIFEDLEALREVRSVQLQGHVRLGVTESVQTTLFPKAFALLRQQAAGIELSLTRGTTPTLLDCLRSGSIDMAVLIQPPSGGNSRLVWRKLSNEPLVLAVPTRLAKLSPLKALQTQPWIRLDRQLVAGRMAAQYVHALVPNCKTLVDVPSIDAIVAMIAEDIGVSVLPQLRAEHLSSGEVSAVSLGRKAPFRTIATVRRKSDAEHRLLDKVEHCFVQASEASTRSSARPTPAK